MTRLRVVHHSPTRCMQTLLDAVLAGAHDDASLGRGRASGRQHRSVVVTI